MQRLHAKTKSLTFPPLYIARYSFIQLSELGRRRENENAQTYRMSFETCLYIPFIVSEFFSTSVMDKSDLNGEVTILQGFLCIVEYNLGLGMGDRNGEVTLLER